MMHRRVLPPVPLLASAVAALWTLVAVVPAHPRWSAAGALPSNPPPGADGAPPVAGWRRPPLLATVADASYGTPVRRLTTATDDLEPILRAGAQVESPDGKLVLVYEDSRSNAFAKGMAVYRREDGRPAPAPTARGGMPHWRPSGPPTLAYYGGSNLFSPGVSLELFAFDVTSGAQRFLAAAPAGQTRSEGLGGVAQTLFGAIPGASSHHWRTGYPSRDGSRYAYSSLRSDESTSGVVVLDLSSSPPTVVGSLTSWPPEWGPLTGARITPSGGAVLVSFAFAGVYVYDAALSSAGRRVMATRLFTDDAADVVVAAGSGHDTLVSVVDDPGVEATGWVVAVDLVTLRQSPLFRLPTDGGGGKEPRVAVSGQAYDFPGWVVLSGEPCAAGADGAWICGKVVAMEVASRRVVPLGHTHSCFRGGVRSRNSGAPASPNRDLSRVYYASGSEACRGTMELYEMETAGRLGSVGVGGRGEGGRKGQVLPTPPSPPPPPPPPVAAPPSASGSTRRPRDEPTTGLNVGIAI